MQFINPDNFPLLLFTAKSTRRLGGEPGRAEMWGGKGRKRDSVAAAAAEEDVAVMKSKQDGSTRGWQTPPLRLLVASRDGSKQLSHPSPSIVPFPLISSSPLPLLASSSPLHSLRIPGSLTALRGPLRELTGRNWNRKHVFGYWKCTDNIDAFARAREALSTEYQESGSAEGLKFTSQLL